MATRYVSFMKRSELLQHTAALGVVTAGLPISGGAEAAREMPIVPLVPQQNGVPVSFLLSDGAVMIDFAG